jgi:hypothetical protein
MEAIVNRAADFLGTYGNVRVKPGEVDHLAIARLRAQNANDRLVEYAHWCYQRNEHGRLAYVLPSGQIPSGSAVPWGASGKLKMTRSDRDILRRWLWAMREHRQFPPWFYHMAERRWYVDFMRYDCLPDALDWLKKHPISPMDWINLGQ